ncbi:MAG TPA: baseplate J/gp47 family protein, partial [Caulobacter sp.]|nr:baseplate J/gp47 family protein [Caulobacter sp.]
RDGLGTVGVTFVMDGREDPIPQPVDVDALAAHLEPLRPVTAEVIVFAPTPEPLDLEISGLDPDNAETQAAVAEEIRDMLFREAEPGGTVLISHLREAISVAAGEQDHVLV